MKNFVIIFLVNIFTLLCSAQDSQKRNLLTGKTGIADISEMLQQAVNWHPYPTIDEPEAWDSYPEFIRTAFIQQGDKYLDYTWPVIPATAALDFVRDGNRTNWENVSFRRRQALTSLVMAELFERQGRFTDQIVNGIWAICEETFWGVSAHLGMQSRGAGLPDVTEPVIDLFAAETSCQMAWTLYLLGSRLDEISPLIRERIEYEIQRRILNPGLARNDFWWMGYDDRSLNNWTPWICSNWLPSVMLIETDPERRAESVYKIMTILDHFLNEYPADGGCDEGPGYWNEAGGALFDCLDNLYSISGGKIDLFNEQLIINMGLYIHRVYISYPYFINFADASATPDPDPFLIYRYGNRINSKELMNFGSFLAVKEWSGPENLFYSFGALGRRQLPALMIFNDVLKYDAGESFESFNWLPDIQVMTARSSKASTDGLFLAAKGGHNNESHNHNDVGNFIVYLNGKPAIIDVGVETYRRQTFSDERYTIWTMQSAYHNLPTINGQMQMNGRQYEARNVTFKESKNGIQFGLNLERAYTNEAGVKSYRRTIDFKGGKEILLKDQYVFNNAQNSIDLNIMTCFGIDENKPGQLVLYNKSNPSDRLKLTYNKEVLTLDIEPIPITDNRLKSVWGDEITRLVFRATNCPSNFVYLVKLVQVN
jgi:hypothetical protein